MDQLNILSQSASLALIIIICLCFVIFGVSYSKKYQGLNKITKLVPVGVFFRASSILLAVLALYFAYEGFHELGEGIEELIH